LFPTLVLYVLQKCGFYIDIPLESLPHLNNKVENVVIIRVSVGISWIFQTTTLFLCLYFVLESLFSTRDENEVVQGFSTIEA